jgi:hypothetical protein
MEKATTLHRNELYKKVWETPISRLAKEYGISGKGLAKICKKLNVPVPPRGYWATIRSGIKLKNSPLPKLRKGAPESHCLNPGLYNNRRSDDLEGFSAEAVQLIASVLESPPIKVSAQLDSPHPVVLKTQKNLENKKPKDHPLIKPTRKGCLNISVTPDNLQRALCIADAVVKGIMEKGFKVARDPEHYSGIHALILGEKIYFSINEKVNRIDHVPTEKEKKEQKSDHWYTWEKYDYIATGKLNLLIDNSSGYKLRKKWTDGKTKKVEDKLNDFLVGAIKVADRTIKERIEAEERKRRWEEERREWEEERRRRQFEEDRLRELLNHAESWTKSQQLRSYIRAVQEAANKLPDLEDFQVKLEEWVSWAEKHADRLDPLSQQLPFEFDNESEDS